jgi:photoactive yellow protein
MPLDFNQADLATQLASCTAGDTDQLNFGVIGIDAETLVRVYNTLEAKMAGLVLAQVMGKPLFTVVAPCMNNFMVAQRFEDTAHEGGGLDATIDYVLTLRMRPIKVKMRLLATPDAPLRYVLVQRVP